MAKRSTPAGVEKPKAPIPAPTEPTAPKAPRAAAAPKSAAVATGEKRTRRNHGRGWLAESIDEVVRQFAAGKLKGVEGPLTVHKISQLVSNPDGEHPSTGAVTAALVRWKDEGYVTINEKPLAFKAMTAKYKDSNLAQFLSDKSEKAAKERAAARAAAKASAPAKPKAAKKQATKAA